MRKVLLIVLMISLFFTLDSCSLVSFDTGIKMDVPENKSILMQGKWNIYKCLKKVNGSFVTSDLAQLSSEDAEFTAGAAKLGNDYCVNPGYKIKSVNSEDYFLNTFGFQPEKLNINDEYINVITLTSEDKFLYDLILIKNGTAIAVLEDNLLFMKKVSNNVDKGFDTEALNKSKEKSLTDTVTGTSKDVKSGIMLGIKSIKEGLNHSAITEYSYKTLWIASDDSVLHPILQTDDILLPRINGFWKVGEERISNSLRDENVYYAERFSETTPPTTQVSTPTVNLWGDISSIIFNSIDYIGNDYISVETSEFTKQSIKNEMIKSSRLWLVPIDSLSNPKGVKISDISGGNGITSLSSAKNSFLQSPELKNTIETDKAIEPENFGIIRKTGHWILRGRYDYILGDKPEFKDFKINLIPPSSVVYYDTLCVPWTSIKDKVPEATDAFTSPLKDIAIIKTSQKLYIYSIKNGILGNTPLEKIKLLDGDSIIMAEWAGGKYVQKWENVFKADNAKKID